jgi:hypothetical protein
MSWQSHPYLAARALAVCSLTPGAKMAHRGTAAASIPLSVPYHEYRVGGTSYHQSRRFAPRLVPGLNAMTLLLRDDWSGQTLPDAVIEKQRPSLLDVEQDLWDAIKRR